MKNILKSIHPGFFVLPLGGLLIVSPLLYSPTEEPEQMDLQGPTEAQWRLSDKQMRDSKERRDQREREVRAMIEAGQCHPYCNQD